jgi:hypothetical protein
MASTRVITFPLPAGGPAVYIRLILMTVKWVCPLDGVNQAIMPVNIDDTKCDVGVYQLAVDI